MKVVSRRRGLKLECNIRLLFLEMLEEVVIGTGIMFNPIPELLVPSL